MSIRAIGARIFNHGRTLVTQYAKRNINTNIIGEKITNNTLQQQSTQTRAVVSPKHFALRHVGAQLGLQARKILIDNVLNRVTNSLSADLRKKATRRILFGDSRPFFALVGVSLASGTGILTKEDELEGICWEIREAISRVKWSYYDINSPLLLDKSKYSDLSLNKLKLGEAIATGTNGVVFTATFSSNINNDSNSSLDNNYPYALKMLYNYDIRSNSMDILRAMYRETVPTPLCMKTGEDEEDWQIEMSKCRKQLPPHPNIVNVYSYFTDYIPGFDNCIEICPAALPQRLNPEGEGRNMSLFVLMKRYDCNLVNYLKETCPTRTSVLILTQLLEGIAHMISHNVAHRDLKTDNLLMDLREPDSPILVISDFGCCLSDKLNGLTVPYTSWGVDKGGNAALMAPEIINQEPGTFSVLNYTKSDLWAAACIAYEIFGSVNPAYHNEDGQCLNKKNYNMDDLPQLPDNVPSIVKKLVANLMQRNPNKRLDADVAANVCQLFLWAPSSWLKPNIKLPSSAEILEWLLSLTTKILCENRTQSDEKIPEMSTRRTFPEYLLISSFLQRAKLYNIRSALSWIHDDD